MPNLKPTRAHAVVYTDDGQLSESQFHQFYLFSRPAAAGKMRPHESVAEVVPRPCGHGEGLQGLG